MTEAQWLAGQDPLTMLGMHGGPGSRDWRRPAHLVGLSDRKLRLFAVAVSQLTDAGRRHHGRGCVGVIRRARRAADDPRADYAGLWRELGAWTVLDPDLDESVRRMADWPRRTPATADALREVVGNPWLLERIGRQGGWDVALDPVLARPLVPLIRSLAVAAYDSCLERSSGPDPARLGVLADALEDAGAACAPCPGCAGRGVRQRYRHAADMHPDWLRCAACAGVGRLAHPAFVHLRGDTAHAQGCWALDLLAGRS